MKKLATVSIRTRLLIAYIGIILIGFSGLTVIAGGQITAAVRAEYEQRMQDAIQLTAQGITPSLLAYANGQLTADDLAAVFKTYETQAGGQLLFYTSGEHELSGPHIVPHPSSFFNMPELETAMRGGIVLVERNNEADEPTLYTAVPIAFDHESRGLLQLSVPAQNLQAGVVQRWVVLGIGFFLVTSGAMIAALWLSRSIIGPLYKLRESALRLSKGDLSHRISPISNDEIGQVARAFNEMANQVQSMLEEQRAFASNTSHELRTPLTAIRLRTEALRNDPTLDDVTARRYIEEMDDEIVRLGDLVEDLTLLSRFDAGRAELGQEHIDCARLAANLVQQMAGQAEEKAIQLSLSVQGEVLPVHASLSHVTVVFRNLLENALKYTPRGGSICWSIKQADHGVHHEIQDTGQGIAPQHLPHIYERFFRADKAHSRDIPGTGLGLSLVQSIIAAYGGRITIESEGANKGTRVSVYWPDDPASRTKP